MVRLAGDSQISSINILLLSTVSHLASSSSFPLPHNLQRIIYLNIPRYTFIIYRRRLYTILSTLRFIVTGLVFPHRRSSPWAWSLQAFESLRYSAVLLTDLIYPIWDNVLDRILSEVAWHRTVLQGKTDFCPQKWMPLQNYIIHLRHPQRLPRSNTLCGSIIEIRLIDALNSVIYRQT